MTEEEFHMISYINKDSGATGAFELKLRSMWQTVYELLVQPHMSSVIVPKEHS